MLHQINKGVLGKGLIDSIKTKDSILTRIKIRRKNSLAKYCVIDFQFFLPCDKTIFTYLSYSSEELYSNRLFFIGSKKKVFIIKCIYSKRLNLTDLINLIKFKIPIWTKSCRRKCSNTKSICITIVTS